MKLFRKHKQSTSNSRFAKSRRKNREYKIIFGIILGFIATEIGIFIIQFFN